MKYILKGNLICDGKKYKKGDEYKGKHVVSLLKSGTIEKVEVAEKKVSKKTKKKASKK